MVNNNDPVLCRCQDQFNALRNELGAIGYFCKGTVLVRKMKCGKKNCACQNDASARHGPYIELTFKRGGKTINIPLRSEQAEIYREGTIEWRRLRKLLQRMERISKRAMARKART